MRKFSSFHFLFTSQNAIVKEEFTERNENSMKMNLNNEQILQGISSCWSLSFIPGANDGEQLSLTRDGVCVLNAVREDGWIIFKMQFDHQVLPCQTTIPHASAPDAYRANPCR